MEKLPVELRIQVCRDVSRNDLVSLCLTSQSYAAWATPLLYENIGDLATFGGGERRRFARLEATIMSRPAYFGPMIKSIIFSDFDRSSSIYPSYNRPPQKRDLTPALCQLTDLRQLTIRTYSGLFDTEYFSKISSDTASTLTHFTSTNIPSCPATITAFLESHPKLTVWRLGRCCDSGDQDRAVPSYPFHFAQGLPHLKICELDIARVGALLSASLLKVMTHLTQLRIDYTLCDDSHTTERFRRTSEQAHLEAFKLCGPRLTHLSVCETPHNGGRWQFSWVLSNLLTHTTNLRHLQLRQRTYTVSATPRLRPPQVLDVSNLEKVKDAFPTSLQTVKWVAEDALLSGGGLSAEGTANAHALFSLFPSLKVVEYYQMRYLYVFRRKVDGDGLSSVRRKSYRMVRGSMFSGLEVSSRYTDEQGIVPDLEYLVSC